jgi:transglutaminase-like putative cysteine protease
VGRSTWIQIAAVMVLMTLMVGALASAFGQVDLTRGRTDDTAYLPGDGKKPIGGNILVVDSGDLGHEKLFQISGTLGTAYLRTNVYNTYFGFGWQKSGDYQGYNGEVLNDVAGIANATDGVVTITPVSGITGQLPVVKNTYQVIWSDQAVLRYSPEQQVFQVGGTIAGMYMVCFKDAEVTEGDVAAVTPDPEHLSEYLFVPSDIEASLKELAEDITRDQTSPVDKMKALETYLEINYAYSTEYETSMSGKDPVLWFLFDSKEGVCSHFNSALALLARCVGIPTRMCSGYLLSETAGVQTVYSDQAHAYVEAMLGDGLWVIFDATPGSPETGLSPNEPAEPEEDLITGYAFDDQNGDGQLNGDEHVLPGKTVVLLDESGVPVQTAICNNAGRFTLTYPGSGTYTVRAYAEENETIGPSDRYVVTSASEAASTLRFGYVEVPPPQGSTATVTAITSIATDGPGGTFDGVTVIDQSSVVHVEGTVSSLLGTVNGLKVQVFVGDTEGDARFLIGEGETVVGGFDVPCIMPASFSSGEYLLIARTMGDDAYAPSEAERTVRMTETTRLTFYGPEWFVTEEDTVFVVTLERTSTGTEIPGVNITVEVWGPSYRASYDISTGPSGLEAYFIIPSAHPPGDYFLNASYGGDLNLSAAVASEEVPSQPAQVDMLSTTLVRGENSTLSGRAHMKDMPMESRPFLVTLYDRQGTEIYRNITITEHDKGGLFYLTVDLPADADLGTYHGTIVGYVTNISVPFTVNLTARPEVSAVTRGDDIVITLTDDHGIPLAGQGLRLRTNAENRTVTTDDAGTATIGRGECGTNLTITYEGSGLYQSAQLAIGLRPPGGDSGPAILLMAGALGAAVVLASGQGRRLWETGRRFKERTLPPPPYRLTMPDITGGLPPVWGEEPLTVAVEGQGKRLKLVVDGRARRVKIGEPVRLELGKGEHMLAVRGLRGSARSTVRIVDYREEVSRVFRSARTAWIAQNGLPSNSSPRQLLGEAGGRADLGPAMETMVDIFERSEYGAHVIGRKEYESMYRASRGVQA